MPIPQNIQREHIFQAMLKIKREGVPAGREARVSAVEYEGETYPLKLLISWGNIFINGHELNYDPNNFTSDSAKRHLNGLGFSIVPIQL